MALILYGYGGPIGFFDQHCERRRYCGHERHCVLNLIGGLADGGITWFSLEEPLAACQGQLCLSTPSVPLPGALPLFATGLGALGLLGFRRKRKAAANAAV